MPPLLSGADPQAGADRAARRRTLQSWGVALVALAIVAFRLWSRDVTAPVEPHPARDATLAPLWALLGLAFAVVTVATNAFTFRYDRPIWRAMRLRFMLCSLALIGFFVAAYVPVEDSIAARLGLDPSQQKILLLGCIAVLVVAISFLGSSVQRSGLLRRLRAKGVGTEELMRGTLVTFALAEVSVTGRSSRPFEAGLLWIEGRELRYVGDQFDLRARPAQVQLTREVIPGTLLGVLGRKGLVLTLPAEDGPMRVRVSPLGAVLPRTELEALDGVSAELAGWQAG